MKMNIWPMGMYVHVFDIAMTMHVAVNHRSRAMHRRESFSDPLSGAGQVQHSQQNQHEADGKFHGETDARRDYQIEEDDSCADQNDGDGVSDAPENPYQASVPDVLLTANNRAHRDHVVGIGCVPDAEQETHTDDRQRTDHGDLPG